MKFSKLKVCKNLDPQNLALYGISCPSNDGINCRARGNNGYSIIVQFDISMLPSAVKWSEAW